MAEEATEEETEVTVGPSEAARREDPEHAELGVNQGKAMAPGDVVSPEGMDLKGVDQQTADSRTDVLGMINGS